MAGPQPVEPVKAIVAVLHDGSSTLRAALDRLRDLWGAIDFEGSDHAFDMTDYYAQEMGRSLRRRLIAFAELQPPEDLASAKLACNGIEDALVSSEGGRRVNLDIGYLDHNKIVLASLKYAGQKIHLGHGVYADLIARYCGGRHEPFEWTFPDFKDGRYDAELGEIRRIYLDQRRARARIG